MKLFNVAIFLSFYHRTDLNPSDMFYSMGRSDRGLVVIFNHEFYDEIDGKAMQTRYGTSIDVEKLTATFSNLGFEIDVQENLTRQEVIEYVNQGEMPCVVI